MNNLPRHFHQTIALHEERDSLWELLKEQIPLLSRGWFELSRLSSTDRIEFTRDFWLSKLLPTMREAEMELALLSFFNNLEEIGIYATQQREHEPFELHMVYSLKGGEGFFHGSLGASSKSLETFVSQFAHMHFPPDYLAFLQIHDGFCKYTDTGILKIKQLSRVYVKFQQLLEAEVIIAPEGDIVNPSNLFPFYESAELHSYQCFYANSYPGEGMANVHLSDREKSQGQISEIYHLHVDQAFPSFLDWLLFYLEEVGF